MKRTLAALPQNLGPEPLNALTEVIQTAFAASPPADEVAFSQLMELMSDFGMSQQCQDQVAAAIAAPIDFETIQLAIRAIFPEGVSFDGNQCRTPRLDEVLRYSLLLDSDCEGVFAGEQGKLLKKSLWVDPAGQKPNTIDPDLVV